MTPIGRNLACSGDDHGGTSGVFAVSALVSCWPILNALQQASQLGQLTTIPFPCMMPHRRDDSPVVSQTTELADPICWTMLCPLMITAGRPSASGTKRSDTPIESTEMKRGATVKRGRRTRGAGETKNDESVSQEWLIVKRRYGKGRRRFERGTADLRRIYGIDKRISERELGSGSLRLIRGWYDGRR